MKTRLSLIIMLLFFNIIIATEFHVKKTDQNNVKFISDAPIENFEGNTNNIDGYIYYNQDLINGAELYFEVDLRTIDTGIGLRNRHMRENYLETDMYPIASFKGQIVSAEAVDKNIVKVKVNGYMDIHGVKMNRDIDGIIEFSNDLMKISTNFIVKLTDHKIEVPSLMFMKIDENMDLRLNFYLEKAD